MKQYGYTDSGESISAPQGWMLLPEGEWVPHEHREATENGSWCAPRKCHSTMTRMYAGVSGYVRAIAVPQHYELVPKGATHVVRDTLQSDFGKPIPRVTYYRQVEELGMRIMKYWSGKDWLRVSKLPFATLAPLQS